MKHTKIMTIIAMMIGLSLIIQSCNKDDDDDDDNNPNPEFVADNDTFKDFMSWPLDASNQGPDPALGPAHAGNDSTVTRNIYFMDGQDPVNGTYPVGTVIVKHSSNPDQSVNEFTAMAKRGNNFAPSGGNWEWFVLTPNGTIAMDGDGNPLRGADLLDGACVSCHSQGSATDFVFSK